MENQATGVLYLVSTPIGNMEDITLRALRILKETPVIFAEDTRSALNLFKYHNIDISLKRIISFFEENEESRQEEVLKYLKDGINIALISESGTPLVSDPGFKLVRSLTENNIKIESIPGPTALISALSVSGLPTNAFLFMGFLPKKETHVKKVLLQTINALEILDQCKTIIVYESPHRLLKTLNLMLEVFGNTKITVARELTKIYEEVRRERVSESIKYFTEHQPRGEFTILLSPK